MDYDKTSPVIKDKKGNKVVVKNVYDNRGESIDRYTITFQIRSPYNDSLRDWVSIVNDNKIYLNCLCLSDDPDNPCGFSQISTCLEGEHLGKIIVFNTLPKNIQKHIIKRMKQ